MKFSQETLSKLTLFLTLILLAVISIILYQKITSLNDYNERVIHTHEVLNRIEEVYSTIKKSESDHRGFLLTGDSTFLETFNNSHTEIDSLLTGIATLSSDNDVQLHRIDSLKKLINKSYETKYMINHLQSNTIANNELLVSSLKKGQGVVDLIRLFLNKMKEEENKLLTIRTDAKNDLASTAPLFILLLTLFSLALILISYSALVQELKKKNEAKKELEIKVNELHRSNNELEQFAYVASHDLQEPLRKIRSFGDRLMIKQSEKLDEDGKMNIVKMQDAAQRMQILIDDLLNFSKLVQSENPFELIDLNEIVRLVLNDLDEILQNKKAKVVLSALPVINAVPSQMYQLFQNLLSNALKFSRKDVPVHIEIISGYAEEEEIKKIKFLVPGKNFYKIEIRDNGVGFEEKYLDRIFTIFQRLHGKLEFGGTGIGLAVSKKIVLNHQGYITATSEPGSGSTFIVYLPA